MNKTKFIDTFSKEIYEQTYKYGNEDINQTHYRIASDLASIEKNKEKWTEEFLYILEDFKFVPGGRITSNAGTELKGTTYINCFVSGFEEGETDQDSMEGIMSELRRQALILKSEGGYGFCADFMRPRGSFIEGIGNSTPGAVKMLDMWDTQSSVITAGSGIKNNKDKAKQKIRKGAQMVTMSIWHPDILEFIRSKQVPGVLTKFNMSVLISDKFMYAVKNNKPWNLEFPDYENAKEEYKKEWKNGNLEEWKKKGYPTKIYKTFENANELWDIVMKSTYNRNEPGVLFIDTINKMNNLWYCEYINSTNPCGEQVLPPSAVCLLGSINLTQFINNNKDDWDYDKLEKVIPIAIRFMDNVNDKTYVPLKSQKESLLNKRRIGLGYLGYGSALMIMKKRYGSKEALDLTEKLCKFVSNIAYKSSALLAKEKGPFPLFNLEKYINGNFIKTLNKETKKLISKYGIRNSHLLSIQPTGNSSIFANNVSGGLEPIFMTEYIRTSTQPYPDKGLIIPTDIDWKNRKMEIDRDSDVVWGWEKEGDEYILSTNFNGIKWKIDQNRGLLKETLVQDYAVRILKDNNEWDENADWNKTTLNLNISEHVNTMKIFSRYIDSAMSKTVNLPNEYPFQDFKNLYLMMYDSGSIKGGTTYRSGTMTSVLSSNNNNKDRDNKIIKTTAPKRPTSLPCKIHHVTAQGKRWVVLIGFLGDDPYEVFSFKEKNLKIPSRYKDGKLNKIKSGQYQLSCDNGDFILEDIKEFFESDEQEALTRMTSAGLRHGLDIEFAVDQLNKSEGSVVSFNKAIARTLKKYLPKYTNIKCEKCGQEDGMVMLEGCEKCKNCGFSKC